MDETLRREAQLIIFNANSESQITAQLKAIGIETTSVKIWDDGYKEVNVIFNDEIITI